MAKVLVLFSSRTGRTAALADAIADGARGVRFTEVDVRRLAGPGAGTATDAGPDEAEGAERLRRYQTLDDPDAAAGYDALVLGGPLQDGEPAPELARFLDRLAPLRDRGALVDVVGAAFTATPTARGGRELLAILAPMGALGMILVPPGYTDPVMLAGGSPFGATATTERGAPAAADLAAARHQGARVAKVAGWVRHAKGHEHGGGHQHHHHHHH